MVGVRRGRLLVCGLLVFLSGAWLGTDARLVGNPESSTHRSSKGRIFCYALARDDPEDTLSLLAGQLQKACDGWAFFGARSEPAAGLIQAYTIAEEQYALKHEMHEMVVAGAWEQMAKMSVAEDYQWIVKFDADTFVRPSTFRSSFERFASSHTSVFSVNDGHDPEHIGLEGFFLAVPTALFHDLRGFFANNRSCDNFVTGHNENQQSHTSLDHCYRMFGTPAPFLDERGLALIASDGEGVPRKPTAEDRAFAANDEESPPGYIECNGIDLRLARHARKVSRQLQRGTPARRNFCECEFAGKGKPVCLSEHFIALHPVDGKERYEDLVRAFP